MARSRGDALPAPPEREEDQPQPEIWIDETARAEAATGAPVSMPRPGPTAAQPRARLPADVVEELAGQMGTARAVPFEEKLAEAARAYERDRYRDALRAVRPLADAAPGAPAVRELHGLTLYRMGRWSEAIRELEAFHSLTGSYDQHPTLADCYRALGRYRAVAELWDELRRASPSAELVAEGRIVAAGAMADQGDVAGAIGLLEKGRTDVRRPRPHHLRLWYALGDLYERAGDVPRARELFRRVIEFDPTLYDVAERVAGLS